MPRFHTVWAAEHTKDTQLLWSTCLPGEVYPSEFSPGRMAAHVKRAEARVNQLAALVSIYKFLCLRNFCPQDLLPAKVYDAESVRGGG
jgi:hypothetical protein